MARLLEQTVQQVAHAYLMRYYRRKTKGNLFAQMEMRTKKAYGSKRADGFLAFRHWLWGTYTISMEAKSYKTLPAVRPTFDHNRYIRNCAGAGLLTALLSGSWIYLFTLDIGFARYLLPVVLFFLGALVYGLLHFRNFRYYQMGVIKQVRQYPANEQWLAFSSDTLWDISSKKIDTIKTLCADTGVGLLLVLSKKRVEILVKPRKRRWTRRDFLRYYAKEQQVRAIIG